jgi:hypothetical protein
MATLPKLKKDTLPATTKAAKKPGRPLGSLNMTTQQMRIAAQAVAGEALDAILFVMRNPLSEAARLQAAGMVLDRAFGKSMLPVELETISVTVLNHEMTSEEMSAAAKRLAERY